MFAVSWTDENIKSLKKYLDDYWIIDPGSEFTAPLCRPRSLVYDLTYLDYERESLDECDGMEATILKQRIKHFGINWPIPYNVLLCDYEDVPLHLDTKKIDAFLIARWRLENGK